LAITSRLSGSPTTSAARSSPAIWRQPKFPTFDLPWIAGAFSAPDQHTAEHKAALKISDELINELLAADEVVISTPMYNFNVPAVLKAWIDHIVRLNKTFAFGPEGLKGLAAGKKVTVIIASGSEYTAGSPLESYNLEGPYFRVIFGFIGHYGPHHRPRRWHERCQPGSGQ
jgi:FMN-dependent NADH-azoreductase